MSISNDFPSGRAYAATALGLLFSVMTLPAWADGNPITMLQAQVAALQHTVSAQGQQISSLSQSVTTPSQAVMTLSNTVTNQTAQIAALKAYVNPLQGVLTFNSASSTVQFTGVNVQIVNGTGSTSTIDANATGNLIIGYNEDNGTARGVCSASSTTIEEVCLKQGGTFTRSLSGSHNLVLGVGNGYSQYGGMVVGLDNLISGPFGVAGGGQQNTASGFSSSVSGGASNTASGGSSSVSGGASNTASEVNSSVSGGLGNIASGSDSSVSGGLGTVESNVDCWAAGGLHSPC
jgi:hypothetical protein